MRAVLYCRTAIANQGIAPSEEPSIQRQLSAGREHCHRKGYEIWEILIDCGISGITRSRPALDQWLLTERAFPDLLIIDSFERLGRNSAIVDNITSDLRTRGIQIELTDTYHP